MTSGLAVGNLGLTNVSVNLELAEQTVDDDLEVQLAHARNGAHARFLVEMRKQGGILFRVAGQSLVEHLAFIGVPGLEGEGDDGGVGLDGFQPDVNPLRVRFARMGAAQANDSHNVSGGGAFELLPVICVQAVDAAHTVVFSPVDVGQAVAFVEAA